MINVGRKNTKIYFVFSLDGIHIVFGRFCYDEGCRWPMQYSGIEKINKLLEMLIMAPARVSVKALVRRLRSSIVTVR